MTAVHPYSASFRRLCQHLGAAALATSVALPSARANDTPERVGVVLAIQSADECVHREGLYAAVQRRSSRVQFTEKAEHEVELDVSPPNTLSGNDVWRADVELTRAGSREPARSIEASDCASLVDAIGFIVALTFDPPSAAKPETPSPAPVAPLTEPRRSQATNKRVDEPQPKELAPQSNSVELHVSTAFEVVTEAGPLLLPGVGVGLSVSSPLQSGLNAAWAAQLQLTGFPGRTVEEPGGQARFRMLAGRLSLCPLAFRQGRFSARPCAFGTWGALDATGRATREPEHHTRPWASVGGALLVGVNATETVRIDLDAGLGATLVRDAFQFEPEIFHQTSNLTARAGMGLSLFLR